MSAPTATSGVQPQASSKRYRLPGIVREGIAQLSLLETALWPLRGGVIDGGTFDTSYRFTTEGQQRESRVSFRENSDTTAIERATIAVLSCSPKSNSP